VTGLKEKCVVHTMDRYNGPAL